MKETSKESIKTYGDKPASFVFTLQDAGLAERYYIGSEVSEKSINK